MKNLTLENLTKVCGGVYFGPSDKLEQEVSSITTDSRKAEAGTLFVPIVGERVDAHKFIPQVMEAGALATLSERILENADFPYIKVESSLQAVKDIAEFYLQQLQIPVIGITGSVGKTSTKEVIASVLKEKYRTLKTQGNFNNELGRIEKTIDESIHNAAYSEINLYYNHYNSSTSFEFKKLNLFPLKFEGEYYSNKDFVIETDITSMIYSLLTFYIMYQLRMCECISRAAENTIRNQITREAIDKIEQIEEEQSNELRKEKKTILINKTVDNYKKLSYMEADNG